MEERARAKQKALELLAYRARSVEELRKKLKAKDFSERTIDRVIDDFLQVGLLDDSQFASAYVHSRMVQKPMGKRLLRQELFSKGIDEEKAEKAIEELYSDRSEFDVAKDLVQKRVRKSKGSEEEMKKQKKKLSQFLLRRGFDWGVISEVLQEE
jgi:regulatory protein